MMSHEDGGGGGVKGGNAAEGYTAPVALPLTVFVFNTN